MKNSKLALLFVIYINIISISILLATPLFLAGCGQQKEEGSVHEHVDTGAKYVCPMHVKITSDKPGKCSKCNMALKQNKGASDHAKHDH